MLLTCVWPTDESNSSLCQQAWLHASQVQPSAATLCPNVPFAGICRRNLNSLPSVNATACSNGLGSVDTGGVNFTAYRSDTPAMVHRIALIRHGESVWNLENIFTGWTDVDLSATGKKEAIQVI